MKKTKFFFVAMMAAAMAVGFTACDTTDPTDPFAPTDPVDPTDPVSESLTVTDVLVKQDGSEATVTGYIVGWFNNKPNPGECVFSTEAPADTTVNQANVLIAATAGETNPANVVCVQLTAGAVRSLVNLGQNPSNLGKEVVVKGLLTSYNGLPGVKTTSYAKIGDKSTDDFAALFLCYRVGLGTLDASTVGAMKVGDNVVLTAKIVNYKGNTPETVMSSGAIVSINGTVPEGAITAADAISVAKALGADVPSTETYTIAGEVTQITENGAVTYKNMTFYIK